MKILAAQINPIIGDLDYNTGLILKYIEKGKNLHADIVLFPELALTGYSPQDLLLLPHFVEAVSKKLETIIASTDNIIAVVGLPRSNPRRLGKNLYNSAAVIQNGRLLGYVDKILLPAYDVFDEKRYFESGETVSFWNIADKKVSIIICEDLWQHSGLVSTTIYRRDPILELQEIHPDLVLNLSASPYSHKKFPDRLKACLKASKTLNCPVILCNQIGANDSLIFDGYSIYTTPEGLISCGKGFEEDAFLIDTGSNQDILNLKRDELADLYQALVLGVRDYFVKQGFKKACLGLSGGIDSALVACLAKDALGASNVLALVMPSRFSSMESERDAVILSKHLGIHHKILSIEAPFECLLTTLRSEFEGKPVDKTEENLQARIRAILLMAFSNKFGYIVLSTGNKSELAMGYTTLYGDMCGGLSVINDLTKSQVFELAEWINREKEVIPWHTVNRPPSAELRDNQKDSDSLPDYALLDKILLAYLEDHDSPQKIADELNLPVEEIIQLVLRIHQNEYKRRQAPPGLRVSEKAFTVGRHYPIVQRWVTS